MKVLFVSDPLYAENEIYNEEAYANVPMLMMMPCELIIATSIDQVYEKISEVDVVLLEGLRAVSFWSQLEFINDYDVFVGAFYCDIWRGPFWYQSNIKINLNIAVYKRISLQAHPTWIEGQNFLWLPPRVKFVGYNEEQKTDIVTWGAMGREYPFRNFIYHALCGSLIGGPRRKARPEKIEECLILNRILVGSIIRTWYHIRGKRLQGPFYGWKLWETLSKCKVCPTGPVVQLKMGSVVGRYFENAISGVVSLSSPMEDAKDLGFIDNETIKITNPENFFFDLVRLLDDNDYRRYISCSAHDLILERHTVNVRADELYACLKEKVGKF